MAAQNPAFQVDPTEEEYFHNESNNLSVRTANLSKRTSSRDSGINSENSFPPSVSTAETSFTEDIDLSSTKRLPPLRPPSPTPLHPPPLPPIITAPPSPPPRPPCGFFCLQSACLSQAAKPAVYLFLISALVFVQSFVVSGYTNSITTTIERRYNLRTTAIGVVVSMYDAACIIATIFVSYYANQLNRARYLGISTVVMAAGFVLFTIPHFIGAGYSLEYGTGTANANKGLCKANVSVNSTGSNCENKAAESWALMTFLLAQFVIGVGASPVYILGPTYLYDILRPIQYPFYSAVMYVSGALGPALGFVMGSVFLSAFIDAPKPPPGSLTRDDTEWLGAWWIGFLVAAGLAFLIALPLTMFHKNFPAWMQEQYAREDNEEKKKEVEKVKEAGDEEEKKKKKKEEEEEKVKEAGDEEEKKRKKKKEEEEEDYSSPTAASFSYGSIKNLPRALKRVFSNLVWLFTSSLSFVEQAIVTAFVAFISKYLQTLYGVPAYQASIITGVVVIPSACLGVVIGSAIIRRLRLNIFYASIILLIISCVSTGFMIVLMFTGCNDFKMAGLHHSYNQTTSSGYVANFTSSCNVGCGCDPANYRPVCAIKTGVTYFSPCHAGCHDVNKINVPGLLESSVVANYTDCSCVPGGHWVEEGRCTQNCQTFIPTLVIIFVMILVTSVGLPSLQIITLRSVEAKDRSFALGMQVLMNRLFAFVPAPIVFGYIFDSVCVLRTRTCLDEEGFCRAYNLERLPFVWIGVLISLKVISILLTVALTYSARRKVNNEVSMDVAQTNIQSIASDPNLQRLGATLADGENAHVIRTVAIRRMSSVAPKEETEKM